MYLTLTIYQYMYLPFIIQVVAHFRKMVSSNPINRETNVSYKNPSHKQNPIDKILRVSIFSNIYKDETIDIEIQSILCCTGYITVACNDSSISFLRQT